MHGLLDGSLSVLATTIPHFRQLQRLSTNVVTSRSACNIQPSVPFMATRVLPNFELFYPRSLLPVFVRACVVSDNKLQVRGNAI